MKPAWEQGYTFDDVLIEPRFSEIESRKNVRLDSYVSNKIYLKFPIISANMASITESTMAEAMARAGGLGILHRFMSIEKNIAEFKKLHEQKLVCGVSVGVGEEELKRAKALIEAGAEFICIDVAHGAQVSVVVQLESIKHIYKNPCVIVGNFASKVSVEQFLTRCKPFYWPDAIKVGVGPGSVCTTRVKTGIGVPQLSAIMSCRRAVGGKIGIIADGGMRNPGDIAKALAAGADAVMLGGMLAGTNEAAGGTSYEGSAANGYGKGWKTAEGVKAKVTPKGPVNDILKDIEGGLRSALTYTGSNNLVEFRENAEFVRVSSSTKYENMPHVKGEIK